MVYPFLMMTLFFIGVVKIQSKGYQNGLFNKVSLQGDFLEVYDIHYKADTSAECSLLCTMRFALSPQCLAYEHHPLDKKCAFYKSATSMVTTSSVHVFKFQETFRSIAVGGQQFIIFKSFVKKTFLEARTYCHDLGAYLLQFDSQEEYQAVAMVLAGKSYSLAYYGANDLAVEGQWVTDKDNATLRPEVCNWRSNEPDNYQGNENCGVIYCFGDGEPPVIGDVDCSAVLTFFCEKPVPV